MPLAHELFGAHEQVVEIQLRRALLLGLEVRAERQQDLAQLDGDARADRGAQLEHGVPQRHVLIVVVGRLPAVDLDPLAPVRPAAAGKASRPARLHQLELEGLPLGGVARIPGQEPSVILHQVAQRDEQVEEAPAHEVARIRERVPVQLHRGFGVAQQRANRSVRAFQLRQLGQLGITRRRAQLHHLAR